MKIPTEIFGINTKEAYEGFLERSRNNVQESEKPEIPEDSSLEDSVDFWRVNNVNYRNGIYTVDLAKTLLDNGNTKKQNEWAEYSVNAKKNNGFYTGDFPLYHALFTELYKLRENPGMRDIAEEARSFLQEMFEQHWLMTLTRIKYKKNGKDVVAHNFNTSREYQIEENIIGPDEWVKDTSNKDVYRAILGDDDINRINEVYKWITGKNAYLWRVNSKSDTERVARFYAVSLRADLDCCGVPSFSDSSLGVRPSAPKNI